MYPKRIVVATRPSKLSLIQTEIAINWIRRYFPDIEFIIKTFKSTGDKILDKPLYEIGVKGIFEKEINLAVLRGDADIAIHSLKDLPASIDPRLELACYPPRDSPYDVLVVPKNFEPDIDKLDRNSKVGTSSIRRKVFLKCLRSDIEVVPIRGNVDTRIRKLLKGECDALIIAECGLDRLRGHIPEIEEVRYSRISLDKIPPAPGQGIIVVVCKRDDVDLLKMLRECSHRETTIEAICERSFLKSFGGGCHTPIGCLATCSGNFLTISAYFADRETYRIYRVSICGSSENPEELGRRCAEELKRLIKSGGM